MNGGHRGIRIASGNCFVSCVVSEGSSLCLRGAPLGQRLEPSLTQGASASPHKALRRCASGEKHPVLRVGGAEGALLAIPRAASDSLPKILIRTKRRSSRKYTEVVLVRPANSL